MISDEAPDEAERAEGKTAYDVVRAWLERHVPDRFDNSREDKRVWLDWAAQNFLADPEIRQHLVPPVSPTS